MAGPFFSATSKPSTLYQYWKKSSLFGLALVTVLCSLSYLLGIWQNNRGGSILTSHLVNSVPCTDIERRTQLPSNPHGLDFSTHHAADDSPMTMVTKHYPPCDIKYSDYTPCEDPKRSLKYKRNRLIYRERHCPQRGELLKCRVPAPFGYKNPLPWPSSRDYAWYANVPHKHLTVEKAVQNWIRFEGDRFKFPGGGTMFPNGADAYIDDIGKLINLKDGSIRTAIDTGCGVASWGAYLPSRNILTMSFAPRDTHEAQVQFALERGVPALIGVLASIRLPYPSRSFDMAHCSRCLIPWGLFGILLS
ncbi:probable methyltransferase PMT16 [Macadamia integrifolia]|uniref:probable methyltransferase PMT16 n=1 Tax=Macadamia integrifolia TaxID=60698 RepID=UPI001C5002CA|nr:probable methyltransferase PMT16 [Macadamia integrifolia]